MNTDPDTASFLAKLEQDLGCSPGTILPLNAELLEHIEALVGNVEVNIDEPLDGNDLLT